MSFYVETSNPVESERYIELYPKNIPTVTVSIANKRFHSTLTQRGRLIDVFPDLRVLH
jgi:hypothetical protein